MDGREGEAPHSSVGAEQGLWAGGHNVEKALLKPDFPFGEPKKFPERLHPFSSLFPCLHCHLHSYPHFVMKQTDKKYLVECKLSKAELH